MASNWPFVIYMAPMKKNTDFYIEVNTFRMLDLCEGKPAVISHISKFQPIMFHSMSIIQEMMV